MAFPGYEVSRVAFPAPYQGDFFSFLSNNDPIPLQICHLIYKSYYYISNCIKTHNQSLYYQDILGCMCLFEINVFEQMVFWTADLI